MKGGKDEGGGALVPRRDEGGRLGLGSSCFSSDLGGTNGNIKYGIEYLIID